jgi:GNAT superfamily N-acetyltransferase
MIIKKDEILKYLYIRLIMNYINFIKMALQLSINRMESPNNVIQSMYKQHEFKIISRLDFWFVLHTNDEIIAECSVIIENDNIFEINDVLVNEKHRGNNYATLLLLNILLYFEEQNKKLMIKICCEKNNIPAFKTYEKIFGSAYRFDSRYAYFSHNL